jgi:redox-sensing transcriptional repressor
MEKSGIERISSKELSQRMGLTASQIRQDFNCFGGYGQQGYGYNVDYLYHEIADILGLNLYKSAILLGAGNLGHALANHLGFEEMGFNLVGIFDISKNVIGQKINGIEVSDLSTLSDFLKNHKVDIGVLTVPRSEAQNLADLLLANGVKYFWNFTNIDIQGEGAVFENVHMGDSLMTLSYRLKNSQ